MKKKINKYYLLVTVLAILLTATITIAVFYEVFQKEIFENLKTYTAVLKTTDLDYENGNMGVENLRVTLIEADGSVVYDSNADVKEMDNHSERPEVLAAFANGEGTAVRRSSTMDKSTFYYAERLEDGSVIRVAKEAGNILSIFENVFPVLAFILIFLFFVCMVLSYFLTKRLVAPIEQLASHLDTIDSVTAYKELTPFITTIQKQHEDIIKSAKTRQEFTANVSHELKTPLTSISGYSELIENGMVTEEDIVRFAGEIHHNSNRLLTLINDIIRLSELDVTDMESQFETLDLYPIAKHCVDLLQVNAENHDITMEITGGECEIYANKEMMEELIYNLCDNAIRYNNKGGKVTLFVGVENGKGVLSVKDTGIGIPEEHQERIFERFYRVDKSRSKLTGGTGLGLAIVKHIVVQHKGKIELNSKTGVGTEIRVIF